LIDGTLSGFDLGEHGPADPALASKGVEGQVSLAAQALQVLRNPFADRILIQGFQIVQIHFGFVGARQKARGFLGAHAWYVAVGWDAWTHWNAW
jgi:hypothetical protein